MHLTKANSHLTTIKIKILKIPITTKSFPASIYNPSQPLPSAPIATHPFSVPIMLPVPEGLIHEIIRYGALWLCLSALASCMWESIMPWHACALPFHCWTYSTGECTSFWLSTPRRMDWGLVSNSWQLWIKPLQTFGSRFLCEHVFISLDKHLGADCRVLWSVLTFAAHGQPLCPSASWERQALGLPIMWQCQASVQGHPHDAVVWLRFPTPLRSRIGSPAPFPSVDALWWSISSSLSLSIF